MATFFEHQHLARRNTKILVLLYAAAVISVILAVDFVLASAYILGVGDGYVHNGNSVSLVTLYRNVPIRIYVWGAIVTAAVILAVSAWHVTKLGGGGAAVAEMVGARRVAPDTRDLLERRYMNVVEEMAIASGVRVPAVYVMDNEPGINAFAAGWDVSNSVVAVTRGTLETLNRDELQGVIGHEFSHILNGDMRLNIRMIGILAGIVFIGSVGEFLMRSQRRSSSSGKRDARVFLIGLGLVLIGYIGLFFARLIKAAVSRQREFLADASSVQYTRNPDGIAGALDRIRAESRGTLIENRHAEDLSHMFFADSVKVWFRGLFGTHPPVEERIARVHPGFQPATYRQKRPPAEPSEEEATKAGMTKKAAAAAVLAGAAGAMADRAGRRGGDIGTHWGRSAGDSAGLVGTLDGGKVDYAKRLLAALPAELREKLHETEGARAALVALLLAGKDSVMEEQLAAARAAGATTLADGARALVPSVRRLGPAFHLPVIDLALPAVKMAPEDSRRDLLRALEAVILADRRVSLHEFVVLTLVRDQLAPKDKAAKAGSRRIADLQAQAALVLSLVAHAGTRQDASGKRGEALAAALAAGAKEMGIDVAAAESAEFTLDKAGAALEALKSLAPLQKAVLVKGLFAAVTNDGAIRLMESELMRLAGAVLDCPLPPLFEHLDPATLVG